MGTPPPQRGDQWPVGQRVQAGVMTGPRLHSQRAPPFEPAGDSALISAVVLATVCPGGGTAALHGANALFPRGSSAATSGQCLKMTLAMVLWATQSIPTG